jgi:hypothetical protein
MELDYNYWTGTDNHVLESLNRSMGQYTRRYKKVKIGITNNPEKRRKEHIRDSLDWDWMIVKYKTSSVNFVIELEEISIDNNWDYIAYKNGGIGNPAKNGMQYLYVLLKE